MNRGELEALVAKYMHRTDLAADIPGFVDLATQRLGRMLKSQVNEISVDHQPTENPSDLPADFRGMRAVYSLEDRGPVALQSQSISRITRFANSGSPAAYNIQGKQILIKPFRAGTYELHYFAEPAALGSPSSENAVLDEYPYLYLYASLVEANIFVKDPDQANAMLNILTSEVFDVNAMSGAARAGGNPQMIGV